MTDPLAEIKARPYATIMQWQRDRDWLVGEVERLRGLLGRLEWAHDAYEGSGGGACPVCYGGGVHAPDCWLAKELHPNEDEASPPKG